MVGASFDALIRQIGSSGAVSRRASLGALLAAAMPSRDPDAAAATKKRKKKRRPKCFGTKTCAYQGGGHDYDDCDFSDSEVFKDGVGAGGSFRRVNFAGANLEGADVSGAKFLNANLNGASFRDADVSGASMDYACTFDTDFTNVTWAGPFIGLSYLCRTILPDGTMSNRDCNIAPRCCGR